MRRGSISVDVDIVVVVAIIIRRANMHSIISTRDHKGLTEQSANMAPSSVNSVRPGVSLLNKWKYP